MSNLPKISVITVVFNGVNTIERTIKSILTQTYPNVEYLIVDGGSTDGTVDIIKSYSNSIAVWISEPDNGIYDAMNKGLRLSTGDFVWFINSGDEIFGEDTLSAVFEQTENPHGVDVFYGHTLIVNDNGKIIGDRRLKPPENLSWKDFINGMLVSHQSIIVSRNVAGMFNTRYKFSADYEWCLLALKKADRIKNTHLVLSKFLDGGTTKQNIIPGLRERFKIMKQHFGIGTILFQHLIIGYRFILFVLKNKRF